jgi:D-3-phosphoglycerate dehydrogenase
VPAAGLADSDALILLVPRFDATSVPADGRLAVVARFGVGYDSVDLDVCTEAGIAVCIAPDGVRRPVAVSILTFVLALSQKLLVKDRFTRRGPEVWARLGDVMGQGLVGRTLGQLGMGSIGAEVCRIAAPSACVSSPRTPMSTPRSRPSSASSSWAWKSSSGGRTSCR